MRRSITAFAALVLGMTANVPVSAQVFTNGPSGSGSQAPGTIVWAFTVPIALAPGLNSTIGIAPGESISTASMIGVSLTCAVGSGLSYDPSIGGVAGNVMAKSSFTVPYHSGSPMHVAMSASVAAFKALSSPMYLCFSKQSLNPVGNMRPGAGELPPASTVVTGTLPGPTGS